ncbi:hypothetical protein CHS0354_009330 [Potamilus streckersoni]|uniref:Uncharacterized protein n=1 Tax=Potamilus streckersoni TaxID=2493646 RepID=A0AAE0VYT5_9BIVA|nr:hypothetical protein CHS0354_009330 [Potamilus streckersoni]
MFVLRKNTKHFLESKSAKTRNIGVLGQTLRVITQTILLHIFAIGTLSYHALMLVKVFRSQPNCPESRLSLCMYISLAIFSILQLFFLWKFIDMRCASFLARTLMSFVFGANINLYLCVLIEETATVLNESRRNYPNMTESCAISVYPETRLSNNDTVYGDATDEASHYLYPFVVEYSLMAVQLLYAVWDISLYKSTTEIDISNSNVELNPVDEEIRLLGVKSRVYCIWELKRMYALYIGLFINIPLCIVTFIKGLVLNRNVKKTSTNRSIRSRDVTLFITAGSVSFFHFFRLVAILNYLPKKDTLGASDDDLLKKP